MKFPQGFLGGVNAAASGSRGICPSCGSLSLGLGMMERAGIGSDPSMGMWASRLGRGIWDFLEFLFPGALNLGLSTWGRSQNSTGGCPILGTPFQLIPTTKPRGKTPKAGFWLWNLVPASRDPRKLGIGAEGGKSILYPKNGNGRNYFSTFCGCTTKGTLPTKKVGSRNEKMGKFSLCVMLDSDIGVRDLCFRIFLFQLRKCSLQN